MDDKGGLTHDLCSVLERHGWRRETPELLWEEREVLAAAINAYHGRPLSIQAIHDWHPREQPTYHCTTARQFTSIYVKSLVRFGLLAEVGSRYEPTAAGRDLFNN